MLPTMEGKKPRPPTATGKGRKTISPTGEQMKNRVIRTTDDEWEKCKRLGGAAWLRAQIRAAKE